MKNGVEYYNIEEQKYNKEEHITTMSSFGLLCEASPLEDSMPRGEGEPLDSGAEAEEAPLGPHNVKRALIQLFKNDTQKKVKIRVNLSDGSNAEFIAPLQRTSNLTNFLKHTGEYKEDARQWFTTLRKHCKDTYGARPEQGKFHLNTGKRTNKIKTITVEPDCYASVVYNAQDRIYVGYVKLYDLILEDIQFESEYLTNLQKKTNVKGQYLYINPCFDLRKRPKTFAQLRKEGKI